MSSSIHSLFRLAVPLLLSASFTAAWAAPTLKVEETATVAAPPAVVWKVIGDYAGLHEWHPAIASTEIAKDIFVGIYRAGFEGARATPGETAKN